MSANLRHVKTETAGRDGDVGVSNGATEVEAVPAPPTGTRRIVTYFHLRNTAGAARDATLRWKKTAGSLTRDLFVAVALADLAQWDPIPAGGSIVLNANDESLVSVLSGTGTGPWCVTWEDYKL